MALQTYIQDKSLDVVIVVPCSDEDVHFVPTLHSIAIQEGIEDLRVGVIFVINNSTDADPDVVTSNQFTYNLLTKCITGEVSEIEDGVVVLGNKRLRVKEVYDAIVLIGKQIGIIDIFSEGNAREHSNVGIARNTGEGFGLALLEDPVKGVVIGTDADTMLNPRYVRNAYDALVANNDGNVGAVTGPWSEQLATVGETPPHAIYLAGVTGRLDYIHHGLFRLYSSDCSVEEDNVLLAGSNTAVRGDVLIEVGRTPPIDAGEDTALSLEILTAGYRTRSLDTLSTSTSMRPSERTAKGFGHGMKKLHDHPDPAAEYMVESMAAVLFKKRLYYLVHSADTLHEKEADWKTGLRTMWDDVRGELPALDDDEIDELWEATQMVPHQLSVYNVYAAKVIGEISDKKIEKVALKQGVATAWAVCRESERTIDRLEIIDSVEREMRTILDIEDRLQAAISSCIERTAAHEEAPEGTEVRLKDIFNFHQEDCELEDNSEILFFIVEAKELFKEFEPFHRQLRDTQNAFAKIVVDEAELSGEDRNFATCLSILGDIIRYLPQLMIMYQLAYAAFHKYSHYIRTLLIQHLVSDDIQAIIDEFLAYITRLFERLNTAYRCVFERMKVICQNGGRDFAAAVRMSSLDEANSRDLYGALPKFVEIVTARGEAVSELRSRFHEFGEEIKALVTQYQAEAEASE